MIVVALAETGKSGKASHRLTTMLLGIVCVLIWLYLLLGNGGFWQVKLRCEASQRVARVVAVVPARDEADAIGAAIRSLLAQTGVELRVVLVDDNSTDGTAAVAREAASWIGAE